MECHVTVLNVAHVVPNERASLTTTDMVCFYWEMTSFRAVLHFEKIAYTKKEG